MKKKNRRVKLYKGFPLVDSKNDLEICVTRADIKHSKKNDPTKCAASLSAQRKLHTEVEVHISRVYVKDNKNKCWKRYLTPHSVSREITSFDRGSAFEEGVYNIKAPSPTQQLDYPKISRHTKTGTGKKLIGKRHVTANVRVFNQ